MQLNPLQLANGSKALLDEMATGKITGEEERYSHTDLWDFDANFEGSQAAIEALRPFLKAKNPTLLATIDERATALDELIELAQEGRRLRPLPRADPGGPQGADRGPRRVLRAGGDRGR